MQEKCNVKKDPKILLACGLEWPRVNYFKWEKPYRHGMTASDLGQNTIKPHNNNTPCNQPRYPSTASAIFAQASSFHIKTVSTAGTFPRN